MRSRDVAKETKPAIRPASWRASGSALATFTLVILLTAIVAAVVQQRNVDEQARIFDREADAAFSQVEQEIEAHLAVVEDVSGFAAATWPGDINEWRRYLEGRVTGGTGLAFTSTAGLVARIPASDVEAVVARERAIDPSFSITEPVPLGPLADRLVLIRTGLGDGIDTRGIELTPATTLLDLDIPQPGERLVVQNIDEAPDVVLSVLGADLEGGTDNDIYGTNVLFVQPVGEAGSEALGWVVIPADLSWLLSSAVSALQTDLSIAVRVPDASIDGDLGRYDGLTGVSLEEAEFSSVRSLELGGWLWSVDMWANGQADRLVGAGMVMLIGSSLALLLAVLVEHRRRHLLRLMDTRVELSIQRSLAETDHLTGLLNRQGLASLFSVSVSGSFVGLTQSSVFFIDLDGFKAINDNLGHAVGDQVLVAVARAIRDVARQGDLVIRLGGDEFLVVCPGMTDVKVAEHRVVELRASIDAISDPVAVRASIGLAVAEPGGTQELDALVAIADASMYREKYARQHSRGER